MTLAPIGVVKIIHVPQSTQEAQFSCLKCYCYYSDSDQWVAKEWLFLTHQLASWANSVGSLHFELWHKHRENVLLLNEQFSIAYGLGHRGGEVGRHEREFLKLLGKLMRGDEVECKPGGWTVL